MKQEQFICEGRQKYEAEDTGSDYTVYNTFFSGCAEEKKAEGTQLSAGLTDRVMDAGQFIPEYSSENTNALSESEIIGFNTGFFNGQADIMNNMLLSSEYSNPGEIDLYQLFYNGIGGTAEQISTEELKLLTEMDSAAPNLDIVKITADEMEAFLQERLGIGLEGTQKTGLENFCYLEEYDSYYVIAGDTNLEWCTIISGIWESDHILRLEYTKESEEGQWEVTLQKVGDGYLFVSNVRASQ